MALALAAATGATAADTRRMLSDDEAVGFRAVGRLNISGARFCTATLVSDRLVLTAAHCLFNPRTGRRVPDAFLRFVAGQVRDTYALVGEVARSAAVTGYGFSDVVEYEDIRIDLALIELTEAVPSDVARPVAVGPMPPDASSFTIVSYAHDRAYAPSIQENCPIRAANDGVAVIACGVTEGNSGSPVLARTADGLRLVAVVSAMATDRDGAGVALSVAAAPRIEALRRALEATDLEAPAGGSHLRPVRRP